MERPDGNNEIPEIPNDISELIADIEDREEQREKAVRIMLERANVAVSEDEREMWLQRAAKMQSVLDNFKEQFPEIYPDDNPTDSDY